MVPDQLEHTIQALLDAGSRDPCLGLRGRPGQQIHHISQLLLLLECQGTCGMCHKNFHRFPEAVCISLYFGSWDVYLALMAQSRLRRASETGQRLCNGR